MESLVLLCLEEKTDARIEYASDEEKRHIIYPSFLLIHIEESTIPHLRWSPFFQERSNLIGLSILVHKLAVELKGKLQDGIHVSALYVKHAIVLQMESLPNVSRSGEKGGPFVSTNGGK